MGFLCCSLYSSTLTAAIFGIFLSIYGISWTGFFLAFFRGAVPINNYTRCLELISNNTTDATINRDIITTSLALHAIWLFASALLVQGNKKRIISIMKIWIFITAVIVITDAAGTGYYIYKAVNSLHLPHANNAELLEDIHETAFTPYIIIAALFSKSGTVLLFTLIALMIYVGKRATEVREQKDFFLRNPHYNYSPSDTLQGHIRDEQGVVYSSREILPPAYATHDRKRNRSQGMMYPMFPTRRSHSPKPNYGLENFGFAIPHAAHPGGHNYRVREPEIDYEDQKGYASREFHY